ncbi:hypothetical protein [Erythrobacter sp. EC-HK427]|uniref:hypothetical protein n=1 Tax=Erythrobacter sp. EC-HK427 TaxID=2038396 RepID=UPI0012556A8D|nr:hypothetical protein [Erythrobacter sp. EC-HK427]VVT04598.1 conserved hypothetical protein [Erythrobacter sp. EC-HK427]
MKLIERLTQGLPDPETAPDADIFMTVAVPGDIDPFERHARFSIPLDAELRLAGLGCSSGGGTLYFERDEWTPDGKDEIAYCIVDIEASHLDKVRELLRFHLPVLGAPAGTLVQFGDREDAYDGSDWVLGQERTVPDPFG